MLTEFLEAGRVVGTHGVRGELRVEPWCDSPEFLRQFKTLYWEKDKTPVEILSSRVHKTLLLVCLRGINTVEQADVLRGRVLCFKRAEAKLPPNTYFHQDIIGLEVKNAETGEDYGKITEVYQTGANDVYEVTGSSSEKILIPAVPQVVKKVSPENGILEIVPMEGMFNEN